MLLTPIEMLKPFSMATDPTVIAGSWAEGERRL